MTEVLSQLAEFSSHIQVEQQLRLDLQTQFAEIVDGVMLTKFELKFTGDDLIGEDSRSLNETTWAGLNEANQIAKTNPNLSFEIRRRSLEREEFYEVVEMAAGSGPNTKVIISDFPPELMDAKQDVGGYNATRKQTMLRIFTRGADGTMTMYSQSLDGSNRQALDSIYKHLGIEPKDGELLGQRISLEFDLERQKTLVDELTGVYDRSLGSQFGGVWSAGRLSVDRRNTYDFVCYQQDLIAECIRLDNLGWLNEKTMYNMAAEMNKRYKAENLGKANIIPPASNLETLAILHRQIESSGGRAREAGISFSACGVTLGAEGMGQNSFEQAGYGNKTNSETSYKFDKKMYCVVCQPKPKRDESKKRCGPCGICRRCDKKFAG